MIWQSTDLGEINSVLIGALDIGGSSVKYGLVEVGTVDTALTTEVKSVALPNNRFVDLEPIVMRVVDEMQSASPGVCAIGISTTGSVKADGVVNADHFDGYTNTSWAARILPRFPNLERVVTVNDGCASAWGEYRADPAPGRSHIHAVVGTGVGGGTVLNGVPLLGDSGLACYIGHLKVTPGSTPRCSCGCTGCVEVLSSAPAIVRYYTEMRGASIDEVLALDVIADAAHGGDDLALSAFARAGRWLGIALGSAMNIINPSSVTVGGGVMLASEAVGPAETGGPFFAAVKEGISVAAHWRVGAAARLDVARLGNNGGLIGVAHLTAAPWRSG